MPYNANQIPNHNPYCLRKEQLKIWMSCQAEVDKLYCGNQQLSIKPTDYCIQYTQISLWVRILHLSLANYKLTCAILIQKPYGMFHSPVKGHSPSQFMDLIHTVISNSTFYETHLPRVVDKMSSPIVCLEMAKKFR